MGQRSYARAMVDTEPRSLPFRIAHAALRFALAQPLRVVRAVLLAPVLLFYAAPVLFVLKALKASGFENSAGSVQAFLNWVGGVHEGETITSVIRFGAVVLRVIAPVYVAITIAAAVRGRKQRTPLKKLVLAHVIAAPVAWSTAALAFVFGNISAPGAEAGLVGVCVLFAFFTVLLGIGATAVSRVIDIAADQFVESVVARVDDAVGTRD